MKERMTGIWIMVRYAEMAGCERLCRGCEIKGQATLKEC